MAGVVDICNRALQKVGAQRIVSLSENSKNARACNACYEALRDAEIQDHEWNFAIRRVELAAALPAPEWGPANAFTLPADFLEILPSDPAHPHYTVNDTDYQIEGKKIITHHTGPLRLRILTIVADPNLFTPLFREALAARIAAEIAVDLTESPGKKQAAEADYERTIRRARRSNSFNNVPKRPPVGSWDTARW